MLNALQSALILAWWFHFWFSPKGFC